MFCLQENEQQPVSLFWGHKQKQPNRITLSMQALPGAANDKALLRDGGQTMQTLQLPGNIHCRRNKGRTGQGKEDMFRGKALKENSVLCDGRTDTLLYLFETPPSPRYLLHTSRCWSGWRPFATFFKRSLYSSGSQSVGRGSSETRKVIPSAPILQATSQQISFLLNYCG